ncbi:hypothetical protein G7046_g638 [Stylonectria norvegica]|nr:hypothetical protein G7046_g638 [Stylonectria norvegica]
MNHDASPSSAAQGNASSTPNADDVPWERSPELEEPSQQQSSTRSRRRKKKKSRRRRNPGLAKKLQFITHLLKSLDTLVFAELSALYYMECSMFRFILRSVGQYMYLTPKDESFPFLMPASRMHVMLVVVPNIICMLLHLLCSLPVGPDYYRGYMHGGLVIDFVGQKPPTSRLYYILADFAILSIQCLMLTVHTDREKLRLTLKTFRPLAPELLQETAAAPTIEDLDAEERGISREMSGVTSINDTDDIELRPLRRPGEEEEEGNEANGESPSLSREVSAEGVATSHLSDVLSSGNAIVGEFHVVQSMRTAAMDLERTAAHSFQTLGYGATMAAIEARRRGANLTIRPAQPKDLRQDLSKGLNPQGRKERGGGGEEKRLPGQPALVRGSRMITTEPDEAHEPLQEVQQSMIRLRRTIKAFESNSWYSAFNNLTLGTLLDRESELLEGVVVDVAPEEKRRESELLEGVVVDVAPEEKRRLEDVLETSSKRQKGESGNIPSWKVSELTYPPKKSAG